MGPTDEKIVNLMREINKLSYADWLENELLTWQWVLLIIVFFGTWIVGIKLLDKNRPFKMLAFAFLTALISTLLDTIGTHMALWYYPITETHIFPGLAPTDLSIMPVTYMLVYQRFKNWISFTVVLTALSFIYSFLVEPLLIKAGIYVLISWKHIYSFPIYIIIGILGKLLFDIIERSTQKKA